MAGGWALDLCVGVMAGYKKDTRQVLLVHVQIRCTNSSGDCYDSPSCIGGDMMMLSRRVLAPEA